MKHMTWWILAMATTAALAGGVTVERRPFLGWDDAIVLSNGTAELVVVPQLGARILSYKLTGGDEWIYTVPDAIRKHLAPGPWPRLLQWHLGGDKVWPMVTNEFPPDPTIDGAPFEAEVAGDGTVTLTGPVSPKYHVRSWRRIALEASGSRVTIDNRFRCEGEYAKGLATWTVTQVPVPEFVLLDAAKDAPHRDVTRLSKDEPRVFWETLSPGLVRYDAALGVTRTPNKIGIYGRWVAAVAGRTAFVQTTDLHPRERYDDGANLEIYACAKYYELEALSPNAKPQPGRDIGHRVVWQIVPLDRTRADLDLAKDILQAAAPTPQEP